MDLTPTTPVVEDTTTYYVYDQRTGDIVLTQRQIIMKGAAVPDKDRMANVLRRRAVFLADTPFENLAVLTVPEAHKPSKGIAGRVDVTSRTLVMTVAPSHFPKP